jgi:hypothetical protein
MTREDIIRMAHEAGLHIATDHDWMPIIALAYAQKFAELVAAAERKKVAVWMMQHGYATGHGDTIEDLLVELDIQIVENWTRALINGVQGEREACAKVCDELVTHTQARGDGDATLAAFSCAAAIRARGQL